MLLSLWTNWWEQWNLYHKVSFDGENKIIIINKDILEIDFKNDIYSAWKEWFLINENSQWLPAIRVVGGDPISAGRNLGATYFLLNGWKLRTWEGDHRLVVNGNIYSEDGSEIFVPTLNSYNTEISLTNSNLVDMVSVNGASVDTSAIASAVWSKLLTQISTPNSIGELIKTIEKKVDDTNAIVLTN